MNIIAAWDVHDWVHYVLGAWGVAVTVAIWKLWHRP